MRDLQAVDDAERRADGGRVASAGDLWLVGAFAIPLVMWVLYMAAFGSINRPQPDVGTARFFLVVLVLVFVGAMGALLVPGWRPSWAWILPGLAIGAALAFMLVAVTEDSYGNGDWLDLGPDFGEFVAGLTFVPLLIAGGVAGLMRYLRKGRVFRFPLLVGATLTTMFAGAGFWLLVTLPQQEERAAQAFESTPGLGFVVLGLSLVAVIAAARRRA